jgi:hypothetical protein
MHEQRIFSHSGNLAPPTMQSARLNSISPLHAKLNCTVTVGIGWEATRVAQVNNEGADERLGRMVELVDGCFHETCCFNDWISLE